MCIIFIYMNIIISRIYCDNKNTMTSVIMVIIDKNGSEYTWYSIVNDETVKILIGLSMVFSDI